MFVHLAIVYNSHMGVTTAYVDGSTFAGIIDVGFCGSTQEGVLAIGQAQTATGSFQAGNEASLRLDSLRIQAFAASAATLDLMKDNFNCVGAFNWYSNWAVTSPRLNEAVTNHAPYTCDTTFETEQGSCKIDKADRATCYTSVADMYLDEGSSSNGTWSYDSPTRTYTLENCYDPQHCDDSAIWFYVDCSTAVTLQVYTDSPTSAVYIRKGWLNENTGKPSFVYGWERWDFGLGSSGWSANSSTIDMGSSSLIIGLVGIERGTAISQVRISSGICTLRKHDSGVANGGVVASRSHFVGKHYFEVTSLGFAVEGDFLVGVGPSDLLDSGGNPGVAGKAHVSLDTGSGDVLSNGVSVATFASCVGVSAGSGLLTRGITWSVAIDLDARKIWFAKEGTWCDGDPAAGTGGTSFPTTLISGVRPHVGTTSGKGNDLKLRAGCNSIFQHQVPTGFSNWGSHYEPLLSSTATNLADSIFPPLFTLFSTGAKPKLTVGRSISVINDRYYRLTFQAQSQSTGTVTSGVADETLAVTVDGRNIAASLPVPDSTGSMTEYVFGFKAESGSEALLAFSLAPPASGTIDVQSITVQRVSPAVELTLGSPVDTMLSGVTSCMYYPYECPRHGSGWDHCGCNYDFYPFKNEETSMELAEIGLTLRCRTEGSIAIVGGGN